MQGYADLYRRQDAILTHHRRELLGPLGVELTEVEMSRDVVFDRGFVTELRLSAERFCKYGAFVAGLKPLPNVEVTGIAQALRMAWPDGWKHFGVITHLGMLQPRSDRPMPISDLLEWLVNFQQWGGLARLRQLSFEGCYIGNVVFEFLSNQAVYPALTHLDLSWNEISDEGVQSLVRSPLRPRLKYLVLGGNPISDEGAFALADAPPTALEYLNLGSTGIGQAGQLRLLRRKGWKVDLF